jgi:stage IV sporulation protein FB
MMTSLLTGYFIELITLFGIVFIHEMGHVAAAKGLGWRIKEVQLLPFGGVVEVDEQGNISAWEETIVALAGPLQNGIMVLFAIMMHKWGGWNNEWSSYFMQANLMIGLFNLLPVLPLDGGKIMQSFFSLLFNYYRTILYCTWLSITMSILIIVVSILQFSSVGIQLNLLMIGLFLLFANGYQLRNIQYQYIRFLMHREIRASKMIERGINAHPIIVQRSEKIKEIMRLFMREQYHLIYVINERGVIQAVFSEQQIIKKYFAENKPGSAVSDLFM